ncbi:MAG: squalene synthase HpnC [Rhodospirillaceae bacterium]|nr:squalene synthase HpnC [Rhodospirillaceae bacterium]
MPGAALSRAVAAALPASKTATQENFPVATLLLHASKRATVMAYYHFARHADDVADSAALTPEEKVAGLLGRENTPAVALAITYRETVNGDPDLIDHAAQLLHAFRRDAVRDYCEDWGDLMTYCRYSAAPVGRFLLDLHGESHDTFPSGDALCAALQVLNHLQDCGKDWAELKRVYIPRDWLTAAGLTVKVLEEKSSPPQLRAIINRMLDSTDGLIEQARPLPAMIKNTRLRLQTAVTLKVAEALSKRLRTGDPLAERVKLSKLDTARVFISGIVHGLTA